MIFGGCPYCDRLIMNYMPNVSPKFSRHECEHCGKTYWLYCSRIDSYALTEEDFLKEYEVDEETKTVRKHETNNPSNP